METKPCLWRQNTQRVQKRVRSTLTRRGEAGREDFLEEVIFKLGHETFPMWLLGKEVTKGTISCVDRAAAPGGQLPDSSR